MKTNCWQGAIITGGAANLKNMEEAFSNRTKIEKVRMAKESQLSLKGGMMELKKDGTCNTIIALLGAGKRKLLPSGTSHETRTSTLR